MKETKIAIKKNIRFVLSVLLFLFGLGLIIFADSLEFKLFGGIYMALSVTLE